jgi:hypothetical protein
MTDAGSSRHVGNQVRVDKNPSTPLPDGEVLGLCLWPGLAVALVRWPAIQ